MSFKKFIAACALLLTICSAHAQDKKPWTFLTYIGGVNNLDDFVDSDLYEMARVGSNEHINILAYVHRFDGDDRITQLIYVEEGRLIIVDERKEDSGDIRSLMNALEWALTEYPSDHIAVDIWNHGSGILNPARAVSFDDISGSYLSDRDCLYALSWAQHTLRDGKKIDILAYDACLMAMVEYAYTFKDCVDYFVASEETIPGDGYDYANALDEFKRGSLSPRAFAENLVTAYQEEYENTPDYTLSAIDTARVDDLVTNLRQLALFLYKELGSKKKKSVSSYLTRCLEKSLSFDDGMYTDLASLYASLLDNLNASGLSSSKKRKLKTIIQSGQRALAACVVKNVTSRMYAQAGGLSMYFPTYYLHSSYNNLYWSESHPLFTTFFEQYLAI